MAADGPQVKDLLLPVMTAWDFPLSRAEKLERVILTLENDLDLADRESDSLRLQLQQMRQLGRKSLEADMGAGLARKSCSCTCRCGAASGDQPGDASELQSVSKVVPVTAVTLPDLSKPPDRSDSDVDAIVEPKPCLQGDLADQMPWDDAIGVDECQSWLPLQLLRSGVRREKRLDRNRSLCGDLPQTAWADDGVSGSVGALQWAEGADGSVSWLQFVPWGSPPQVAQAPKMSGEFHLQPGETVVQLRGRTTKSDGRVADWIDIITSRCRVLRMGNGNSSIAKFNFQAETGTEIVGIIQDGSQGAGGIKGVQTRSLDLDPSPLPGNSQCAARGASLAVGQNPAAASLRTSLTSSKCRTSRASAGAVAAGLPGCSGSSQLPRSSRPSSSSSEAPTSFISASSPAAKIRALAAAASGSSAARRRLSS